MKLFNFSILKLLIVFFCIPLIVQGDNSKWFPAQFTKLELLLGDKVIASATTDRAGNCTFKDIPLKAGAEYNIRIASSKEKTKKRKWTGQEKLKIDIFVTKKNEREALIKKSSEMGAEIIKPLKEGMKAKIISYQLPEKRIQKTGKARLEMMQLFNIKVCAQGGPYSHSFSNLDDN